jgi:hypothetical protein
LHETHSEHLHLKPKMITSVYQAQTSHGNREHQLQSSDSDNAVNGNHPNADFTSDWSDDDAFVEQRTYNPRISVDDDFSPTANSTHTINHKFYTTMGAQTCEDLHLLVVDQSIINGNNDTNNRQVSPATAARHRSFIMRQPLYQHLMHTTPDVPQLTSIMRVGGLPLGKPLHMCRHRQYKTAQCRAVRALVATSRCQAVVLWRRPSCAPALVTQCLAQAVVRRRAAIQALSLRTWRACRPCVIALRVVVSWAANVHFGVNCKR